MKEREREREKERQSNTVRHGLVTTTTGYPKSKRPTKNFVLTQSQTKILVTQKGNRGRRMNPSLPELQLCLRVQRDQTRHACPWDPVKRVRGESVTLSVKSLAHTLTGSPIGPWSPLCPFSPCEESQVRLAYMDYMASAFHLRDHPCDHLSHDRPAALCVLVVPWDRVGLGVHRPVGWEKHQRMQGSEGSSLTYSMGGMCGASAMPSSCRRRILRYCKQIKVNYWSQVAHPLLLTESPRSPLSPLTPG